MDNYSQEIQNIQKRNQTLLDEFRGALENANLATKTVKTHIENIDFFSIFLIRYLPLSKLDETQPVDVQRFLAEWYPNKTTWASPYNTKSYMSSFRKFFKFLRENGKFDIEVENEIKKMLKENKKIFLDAVDFGDDW